MVKRRTSRRTTRRSLKGRTRGVSRRSVRRSAKRSARRSAKRSKESKGTDAISDILSAAYGIERKRGAVRPPPIPPNRKGKVVKKSQQSDMDSFLKGIKSSGPYELNIFDNDEKGFRVAKRGPAVKDPYKKKEKKEKKEKREKKAKKKTDNAWIRHVKSVYSEKVKGNPNFKYKDALKIARKTYNQ